ncbi:molybdopterin-dependent oxidoreductase [Candidatus Poriferisodalis sp.]|uniref:molybdopterin-dependent oxidoreductase n=1 Tax=Candidatus Poriferisodalis sp. TaxID=3101277 RepID=UPI003B026FB6
MALAFGELVDALAETIPSLVVAVGETLVDYSPDWAVRLSIELFGENDKTAVAAGIVGLTLIIGGLLGASAMAPRRRWLQVAGFAGLAVIGGWSAARHPLSPFVRSWLVAVAAALLGYLTLTLLSRVAVTRGDLGRSGSSLARKGPAGVGPPAHEPADIAAPDNGADPGFSPQLGPTPGTSPDPSRRAFLRSVGSAAVAAVGLVALGRVLRGPSAAETARAGISLNPSTPPSSPASIPPGIPPTSTSAAGTPSSTAPTATTAAQRRLAAELASLETLDEVEGISTYLTSNRDFYRIDTALTVPQVDPATWRLRFTGMVDRPYELTFDEILAMDLQERVITLSCVSNPVGGSLVGNAVWTGVPLADLLDRAGIRQGADQIVGRSVDDWTAGFPTEVVRDGRNAMLAVGMNGEPLPTQHGFPARLLVAGLYGYVSAVKWVEEIRLTTWDGFDGFWVPRGWSKRGPMKIQSRIDVPGRGTRPVAGSETSIAGIAWAPTRGIGTVEMRVDGGPWQRCELGEAISGETWVQWHRRWTPTAGTHVLQVRATDSAGTVQPEGPVDVRPDGAEGWHRIAVRVDAA